MTLSGKNALVFCASGAIAGGVSKLMASRGARVFISARHENMLDRLRAEIGTDHPKAETIDALNEEAVDAFVGRVAGRFGKVDVVFSGMGS